MKKTGIIGLGLLLVAISSAGASIREIRSMHEINDKINSDTLLVFDIDNTLIAPTGNLGSDQWFYYLYKIYKINGMNESEIAAKAMDTWNKAQDVIRVEPVEKDTPAWISKTQSEGVKTLAVTARNTQIMQRTLDQLVSAQIVFKNHSLLNQERQISKHTLKSDDDAFYKDGVLFVGESNNKGQVLAHFLESIHYSAKKIIFVDDKEKHVKGMEAVFSRLRIPFFGYRYAALDSRVEAFNGLMSEVTDKPSSQLLLLGIYE